jgi:hypothetical protein
MADVALDRPYGLVLWHGVGPFERQADGAEHEGQPEGAEDTATGGSGGTRGSERGNPEVTGGWSEHTTSR